MNIYHLLKIYQRIKNPRIKLLGILLLHVTKRRYVSLYIDPVMACNLQCQMCYFSNEDERKRLYGKFSDEDIDAIARAIFHRVIRLQIGCGAEPTIYNHLEELVRKGKLAGIPYISITTNGNLLNEEKLQRLVEAGLNEITVSAHGFTKYTYESLMKHGSFEKFLQLIEALKAIRRQTPDLKFRVNYTVNEDNIEELPIFSKLFKGIMPNILQIRPIQDLGETAYSNFSLKKIREKYDQCIIPLVRYCEQNNVTCIYPTQENLQELASEKGESPHNDIINYLPYFNLSPFEGWRNDKIDPYTETFEAYCKRTHRVRFIIKNLFACQRNKEQTGEDRTKALNYNIR